MFRGSSTSSTAAASLASSTRSTVWAATPIRRRGPLRTFCSRSIRDSLRSRTTADRRGLKLPLEGSPVLDAGDVSARARLGQRALRPISADRHTNVSSARSTWVPWNCNPTRIPSCQAITTPTASSIQGTSPSGEICWILSSRPTRVPTETETVGWTRRTTSSGSRTSAAGCSLPVARVRGQPRCRRPPRQWKARPRRLGSTPRRRKMRRCESRRAKPSRLPSRSRCVLPVSQDRQPVPNATVDFDPLPVAATRP